MNIRSIFRRVNFKNSEEILPFGNSGQALLLNDTSGSYHWGCYGTSMMIYNELISAGYSIRSFDVETTHYGLPNPPETASNLKFLEFASQMKELNPFLHRQIERADLVVINGEGTIHGFWSGTRKLLSLIRILRLVYHKRVHLINHSCFPSGLQTETFPEREVFYQECLKDLERVVVRDSLSKDVYKRLGINCDQGFDCLPLYDARFVSPKIDGQSVVIGAASHWQEATAIRVASEINKHLGSSSSIRFLAGGFKSEPPEDLSHYLAMKSVIPNLQLYRPATFDDWMTAFRSAQILISGRFHHYIAALAAKTPSVIFGGNSPKSDAVATMFSHPLAINENTDAWQTTLAERIRNPVKTDDKQVKQILELAKVNFSFTGNRLMN